MKVALVGTANCGKTTLINELDKQQSFKGHNIITDVAGKYFTKSERQFLTTQKKIMEKQISIEQSFANFISDRSVIDNQAYFMYHYRKAAAKGHHDKLFGDYFFTFNQHMRSKPYDAIVFIDDIFTIEDNGMREVDKEMQEWVFEWLETEVPTWCDIYNIPMYKVHGSTEDRIKRIKSQLKKHYTQKRVSDYNV